MSPKKTPKVSKKMFDISKETNKHYPRDQESYSSKDACVQTFSYYKVRKGPSLLSLGLYSY
jgi:hypothetical protein